MKTKSIMMLLVAVFTVSAVYAVSINAGNVPDAVQKAFKAKFPKAEDVKWEHEKDGTYEADFEMKDKEYEAAFKADGTWIYTATEISKDALPDAVKQVLKSDYEGWKIDEVKKLDHSQYGECYEVEAENADTEVELLISAKGKVLSEQVEGEEDDDDDDDEDEHDEHEGHDHSH